MSLPRWTAVAVAAAVLSLASPASAAPGELGNDVGFPQCGGALPAGGAFGIVGVNNGRPFSTNPCLATQATWAAALPDQALYVNTANPGPTSVNWPDAGTGACVDDTTTTDPGCAYDYGRKAALDTLARATTALEGTGLDPLAVTWWLDVEGSRTPGQPGNSWVGDGRSNAADLQGYVDALRTAGVPEVGVYSTAFQWHDITEAYRPTSGHRTGWPFPARFPLEDGPVWFAGVGTLAQAQARCATASFTGGERLLGQYLAVTFDGDVRCADPDTTPPTASLTGPTAAVSSTPRTSITWTGSDGGTGVTSYDVRARAAGTGRTPGPWTAVPGWQRTVATAGDLAAPAVGASRCVQVRSRDAAGGVSSWSAQRCTATPLDDRHLSAGAGWTRGTQSGYVAGTWTQSTVRGATLQRPRVLGGQLHLLALTCPTCGRVAVSVAGTDVGVLDLRSSTTRVATLALPPAAAGVGRLELRVVSTDRLVRIDGLASAPA